MTSVVIGVIFAALITGRRPRGSLTPIVVGVAYGLGAWVVMRYGILPLNSGEDDLFSRTDPNHQRRTVLPKLALR